MPEKLSKKHLINASNKKTISSNTAGGIKNVNAIDKMEYIACLKKLISMNWLIIWIPINITIILKIGLAKIAT